MYNFYKPMVTTVLMFYFILISAWQCQAQVPPQPKDLIMTSNLTATFIYQIGIPAWDGGETTLAISPTGEATIKNRRDGQADRAFSGMLTPTELETLYILIEEADLWSQTQRKTAVPDEAPVTISLTQDGQVINSVDLWQNQFQETEALQAFRGIVQGHISTISKGEVY